MPQQMNPILERTDVIIVSLEPDTKEMEELARSMNYSVKRTFVQKRPSPDPRFFIGSGKVDEIKQFLTTPDGKNVKVATFNSPLKPTQIFHLQNALGLTVYDRTRLILEIFSNRARSQEAKLQVELAKLEYEVPLVKEFIHRSKTGEHAGYMAGGEYPVNTYYDMITKRIKRIKEKLRTVKTDRSERRKHRRDEGFFLISIAGYTNAGKSQLLKALTKEDVIIEDRFFSTLFTITRKGEGRLGGAFLFSDTVGFIRNLPPWLVEAFNSTLEEIYLSDIIFLVVDISENSEVIVQKVVTSYKFFQYQDSVPSIILVFNKKDLVPDRNLLNTKVVNILEQLKGRNIPLLDYSIVSAKNKENLEDLMSRLIISVQKLDYIKNLVLTFNKEKNQQQLSNIEVLANWLFSNYVILKSSKDNHSISFEVLIKCSDLRKINSRVSELNLLLEI
jgi:GTP-binding protein HflX